MRRSFRSWARVAAQDASAALLALDRIYMDGRDIRSSLERLAAYFPRRPALPDGAGRRAEALVPGFDHDELFARRKAFFAASRHGHYVRAAKTVDAMQRASGGRLEAELCLIRALRSAGVWWGYGGAGRTARGA